jgi:hypothetical protein
MVLCDLPMASEASALEHAGGTEADERSVHFPVSHIFRIRFDKTSARFGDEPQRAFQSETGDFSAAISPVHEKASYPPVGFGLQALEIGFLELVAGGDFITSPELTPANRYVTIKNDGSVSPPLAYEGVFVVFLFSEACVTGFLILLESHAPAAAPNAVVTFNQVCIGGPGGLVERFDDEVIHVQFGLMSG